MQITDANSVKETEKQIATDRQNNKKFSKNFSHLQLTDNRVSMFSKELKFVLTPVRDDYNIKCQLLQDFGNLHEVCSSNTYFMQKIKSHILSTSILTGYRRFKNQLPQRGFQMNFASSDECFSVYEVSFKEDKLIYTILFRENELQDFSRVATSLPVNLPEKEDTANGAEGIGL